MKPIAEMSDIEIAAELVQIDEQWLKLKERSDLLFKELKLRNASLMDIDNDRAD